MVWPPLQVLAHHEIFQAKYYGDALKIDPDIRDRYKHRLTGSSTSRKGRLFFCSRAVPLNGGCRVPRTSPPARACARAYIHICIAMLCVPAPSPRPPLTWRGTGGGGAAAPLPCMLSGWAGTRARRSC